MMSDARATELWMQVRRITLPVEGDLARELQSSVPAFADYHPRPHRMGGEYMDRCLDCGWSYYFADHAGCPGRLF